MEIIWKLSFKISLLGFSLFVCNLPGQTLSGTAVSGQGSPLNGCSVTLTSIQKTTITVNGAFEFTGITSTKKSLFKSHYPSYSHGLLSININEKSALIIELFDHSGKRIFQPVSKNLTSGQYELDPLFFFPGLNPNQIIILKLTIGVSTSFHIISPLSKNLFRNGLKKKSIEQPLYKSGNNFSDTLIINCSGLPSKRKIINNYNQNLGNIKVYQPNIVFLLADDLGYGDLGIYGHPIIKTPHLDQLAKEGMRFNHAYAPSSNCSPSRAAILTGRTPYRVGMYDFMRTGSPMHIPLDETTIATVLKNGGYQTMFAGKWHLSGDFNSSQQPGLSEHGFNYWLANEKNFDQNPNSMVRNGQPAGQLTGIQSQILVDEAITWLETLRNPNDPFAMFIWFNEPHTPVRASQSFKDMYATIDPVEFQKIGYGGPGVDRSSSNVSQISTYFGCVSQMDSEIGRLLSKLDQLQLRDNTLVVFTSDNGPEHRANTSWGSSGPLRGAKGHMHEGGIRVPAIFRWPGEIETDVINDLPINGTDFFSTFSSLAGITPILTKPIDGSDLTPTLLNNGTLKRNVPLFWWLFHARGGKQIALRSGDLKILAAMSPQGNQTNFGNNPPAGTTWMDYIKNSPLESFELYNLLADINESNELSGSMANQHETLSQLTDSLYKAIQKGGPVWSSITGVNGQ